MMKTGTGTYTLTAQLCGLWHEFKTVTQDARLFDSFGVADFEEVEYVTEAVRNLITDQLLAHQVEVGKMKGFLINESLWLPTPPAKQMWESGMPISGYFEWGMEEYWLTPVQYVAEASDGRGTFHSETFHAMRDAIEFCSTHRYGKIERCANGIKF